MAKYRLSDVSFRDMLNKSITVKGMMTKFEVKVAKNNSKYANIVIRDKDKEAEIRWWDYDEENNIYMVIGNVYEFCVVVQPYDRGKDGVSLSIDKNAEYSISTTIEKAEDYLNKEDNAEWAYSTVEKYLNELQGYELHPLVMGLINDNYTLYASNSAANSFHHTGIGGLLVHSAGVCQLSVEIAKMYNKLYGKNFINRNILIAGALLHDIGKVRELAFDVKKGGSEYTPMSVLESHIVFGIEMVATKAAQLGLSDRTSVKELIHIIASHHKLVEYGSPIAPATIEAQIIASADDLDAICNRYKRVYKDLKEGEGISEWKGGQKLSYFRSANDGVIPKI